MSTSQIIIVDGKPFVDYQALKEDLILTFKDLFVIQEPEKPKDVLLTRKEVLELLHIVPSTLYNLTKSGKLKYVRHGRKMFFKQSDLMK